MKIIYKLKRLKLLNLRLHLRIKNFRLEDGETIENVYNKLIHI
jgi:hypothetical protein